MASASAIKAGEAFVRISLENEGLERGLKITQAKLNRFAVTASKVGLSIGAIGTVGAAGLTKAVSAANQVELTGRRLEAVFRDSSDAARDFAKTLAVEIGESRFALERTLTTFKSFFAEIVEGDDLQIEFSENLTKLSRDFAAFQGLTSEDALQRFISALSGSPEVLDRFGINLKAAAIDADLAARGIEGTTATVSEFQKVLSRIRIIEQTLGSQGAIGKARQELVTFSGAARAAGNAVFDFTVAIGQSLLPVLRPLVATFANVAQGFTQLANAAPVLTVAFAAIVGGGLFLSAALVAAGVAAAGLSFAIGSAVTVFNAYSGFVKNAGLQTASFATVLQVATQQMSGYAAGAVVAASNAAGVGVSAAQAAAGVAKFRTAIVSTLGVLGRVAAISLLASAALGTVPGSGPAIIAVLAASAAAYVLVATAIRKVAAAAAVASTQLAVYTAAQYASITASQKAVIWTSAFSARLGKSAIALKAVASGFKIVAAAGKILAAVFTTAGIAFAAVGVALAAFALGTVGLAKEFGLFTKAADSFGNSLDRLSTNYPTASAFAEEFGRSVKKGFREAGDAISKYKKISGEGLELITDAAKSISFGLLGETSTEKQQREVAERQAKISAEREKANEKASEELIKAERRVQDARIAGIQDTAKRRRAVLRAEIKRDIEDEIAKSSEIQSVRQRFEDQLKQIDGREEGAQARIEAIRAEQRVAVSEAIANNRTINSIKEEGAIKQANLERSLAREVFNEQLEHTGRLRRARIEATKEGAARELALVIERQERETKKAKQEGGDLTELARAQAQERANVISGFTKQVVDEEKALQQEIADARIDSIEDEAKRREAQIRNEFNLRLKEIEEAKKARRELDRLTPGVNFEASQSLIAQEFNLRRLREIKLSNLRKDLREEEDAEQEQVQKDRADALRAVQDDIEDLSVDISTPEGLERTLAKISLERRRAIREAGGDERLIEKLNQKFELREIAARQQGSVTQGRTLGSFDAIQIRAFATATPGKSREQELLERQLQEAERQTRIQQEIRDGQGAR